MLLVANTAAGGSFELGISVATLVFMLLPACYGLQMVLDEIWMGKHGKQLSPPWLLRAQMWLGTRRDAALRCCGGRSQTRATTSEPSAGLELGLLSPVDNAASYSGLGASTLAQQLGFDPHGPHGGNVARVEEAPVQMLNPAALSTTQSDDELARSLQDQLNQPVASTELRHLAHSAANPKMTLSSAAQRNPRLSDSRPRFGTAEWNQQHTQAPAKTRANAATEVASNAGLSEEDAL